MILVVFLPLSPSSIVMKWVMYKEVQMNIFIHYANHIYPKNWGLGQERDGPPFGHPKGFAVWCWWSKGGVHRWFFL